MTFLGEAAANLSALSGVSHRFFNRVGGTSPPPFDRLNTTASVGDAPARVEENLARCRFQIGVGRQALYTVSQVHGDRVLEVSAGDDVEQAAEEKADAVFTTSPDVAVAIRTADCVPILLADKKGRAVAAVHAGWRGAVGGVLEATLKTFAAHGCGPADVVAAVGPAISWDNFEVGPEVVEVAAQVDDVSGLVRDGDGDRKYFDLPGFVERRLRSSGVTAVERVGGCTVADDARYFSHRRDQGRTGRQLSAIALCAPPTIDPDMFG